MKKQCAVYVATALIAVWSSAQAGYRPFVFNYDAYLMPKGNIELEQGVTYRGHTRDDRNFKNFEFTEEIEYGVADNIRLGLYVPTWSYERSTDRQSVQFDEVSAELILNLANPVTAPFGAALYFEAGGGQHTLGFESKLILHKDVGPWTAIYNLTVDTDVEGVGDVSQQNSVMGVLGHALGVSYGITPVWRLGAEALAESTYENWSGYDGTAAYVGPSVSYQGGEIFKSHSTWWFTLTPTVQLTHRAEPDYLARVLVGVSL
ncbi:MAG: hypothetical protein EPN23_04125 [Verrucomicrobia bacterium]|nr:MAG: hypothetical protein EPN23_04125 [Verrucomicrobiota bacterium]